MRSATLVSLQPSADVWDWDCSPVRTEREARHIAAAPYSPKRYRYQGEQTTSVRDGVKQLSRASQLSLANTYDLCFQVQLLSPSLRHTLQNDQSLCLPMQAIQAVRLLEVEQR